MALRASPYGFIEPCSLQPREPVQGALVPHQREVVACDDNGLAVFELLRRKSEGRHVIVFDLLKLDGDDLRREPFETRKATLASCCASLPGLRLNELAHPGDVVFQHACKLGLEGFVSKRLGSRYRSGRRTTGLS